MSGYPNYSYAKLGESCQVSMNDILDNTKFFAPKAEIYKKIYTDMRQYPGPTLWITENKKEPQSKGQQESTKQSCCGH
jgi:hypothetical protein